MVWSFRGNTSTKLPCLENKEKTQWQQQKALKPSWQNVCTTMQHKHRIVHPRTPKTIGLPLRQAEDSIKSVSTGKYCKRESFDRVTVSQTGLIRGSSRKWANFVQPSRSGQVFRIYHGKNWAAYRTEVRTMKKKKKMCIEVGRFIEQEMANKGFNVSLAITIYRHQMTKPQKRADIL